MKTLWHTDRALTGTAVLMLPFLSFSLAGLVLDPRTITGAPAWLKPAKFAVSIALFTLTLAWIFTYLRERPRLRRVVASVTSATFVTEMVIIFLQAWRGTTSHFNVATPFDTALWIAMGSAIAVQTIATVAVTYAVWRQPFADRALGWALRLGLAISILGASTGALMTRPTATQLAEAKAGGRVTVAGAHTVGGPDGGPGLPGTGWSVTHGDLRVPHFLGLHALQVLPLFAVWLSSRRFSDRARLQLVLVAGFSYGSLFAILLWQALRGDSLVRPEGPVVAALAAWLIATSIATLGTTWRKPVHVAP